MRRSPYDILRVAPSASLAEVKASFRRLAKACHPDTAPGDAAAARRFQELRDAYAAVLAGARTGAPPRADGARPSSARPAASSQATAPRPGAHRRARVTLSLEEAIAGGAREVAFGPQTLRRVHIPPGVEDGSTLRLKGLGEPGRDGGAPGDGLVTIRLAPHPYFRFAGPNAHLVMRAAPRQLAQGDELETPTPVGRVMLRLPVGSRPGQVLRLRGKGLPARGTRPSGDLFVTLRIGEAAGPVSLAALAAERAAPPAAA